MNKRERAKESGPWRISPPAEAVSLLRSPTAAADYIGLSLHHGSLPFVSLNGIHITFSPFLLGFIAILGVSSTIYVEKFPESLLFPLLALLLLFAQLSGNLIFGSMMRTRPKSLILSLSGVIDPGLIFDNEDATIQEDDVYSERVRKRNLRLAPLRALGSSLGAACFLLALSKSPIYPVLFAEAGVIAYIFWMFGCFVVIAPFLSPHKMNEGFRHQLTNAVLPIFFLAGFLFMSQEASFFQLGESELAFFFFALILRGYWWNRITSLSKIAQQISIGDAMIPLNDLTILTHGETISSAQVRALSEPQSIFPIISGTRLIGYIEKELLLRIPYIDDQEDEFISEAAIQSINCIDPGATLENAFGPELPLPLFVMEDDEIIGVITSEQVRDALVLALTGHPRFPNIDNLNKHTRRKENSKDDS